MEKSDLFAAHFEQYFNSTVSRIDLRKYIELKVLNQLNPIGEMKKVTFLFYGHYPVQISTV